MATVKDLLRKLAELEQLKKELSINLSDAYGNIIEVEVEDDIDGVCFYMTGEHCRFVISIEEMKKLADWLYRILAEERGGGEGQEG